MNLIGFLLPPLIDLVNRKIVDQDLRFWFSVFVCSLVGVGVNYIESNGFAGYSDLTLMEVAESLSASAMVMFGVAQLGYKAIWEKSTVREDLGLKAN